MWWYVFMAVCGFTVGWLGADIVRALRRPKAIANPYLNQHQRSGLDYADRDEPHRFTRPSGWHP